MEYFWGHCDSRHDADWTRALKECFLPRETNYSIANSLCPLQQLAVTLALRDSDTVAVSLGRKCCIVSPLLYQKKVYSSCTSFNHHVEWCYTPARGTIQPPTPPTVNLGLLFGQFAATPVQGSPWESKVLRARWIASFPASFYF